MELTEIPPTVHANKSACVARGCQITLLKLVVSRILATEGEISTTNPKHRMVVFRALERNTSPRRPFICTFVGAGYGVVPTWNLGMKLKELRVLAKTKLLRVHHLPKSQASNGVTGPKHPSKGEQNANAQMGAGKPRHRAPVSLKAGAGSSRIWLTSQAPRANHLGGWGGKKEWFEAAKETNS